MTSRDSSLSVVPLSDQNDPFRDAPTGLDGQAAAGIAIDSAYPGFLTGFDGAYIFYRVPLDPVEKNVRKPLYDGRFWIGIDSASKG